jgi:hypothetical protein
MPPFYGVGIKSSGPLGLGAAGLVSMDALTPRRRQRIVRE